MRKYFFILVLFLSLSSQLFSQNWFPLEVGNKWQYISVNYQGNYTVPDTSIFNISIFLNEVLKDSFINNEVYYSLSNNPANWFRFSISEQKIFYWFNNEDKLIMDFTLPNNTQFISFWPEPDSEQVNARIITGDMLFLDTLFSYKGFTSDITIDGVLEKSYKYIPNYGIVVDSFYHAENAGLWYESKILRLVQAKINGTIYRGSEKPEIIFNPVTSIPDSNFNLAIDVDHSYNILFPSGSSFNGLNYIDTVYLHSFYSRADTIINNSVISATNIAETETWNVNTILDMNLLKNDFKFNYRIEAIDKGMFPYHSFSPDTGYFTAIWDTTSSVKTYEEMITSYSLYQNYPNPFNPATTIKYQIPEDSFVTLKLYGVLCHEIATLVNEYQTAGIHEVQFNAQLNSWFPASGVYIYQLRAGSFVETKKMILLK